jgi:predicted porin
MTDKRLVALMAFLLAGGVTVARADVTLFGQGNEGLAGNDPQAGSGDPASTCVDCAFGLGGSEELGNGLRAVFRMDWQYQPGNTGMEPAGRDQWLGIGGDFGEVKVGTLSSRYKTQGAVPDPVYDALLPFRENDLQSGTDNHDRNEGVGLSYENAGILVFADYINGKTGSNDAAYKVGAKYTVNNFTMFGQYKVDNSLVNGVETQPPVGGTDAWFLGGGLTLGNSSLYAGYGKGDDGVDSGSLTGFNSWQIVGVHSLNKFTSIFAGYSGVGCIDKNTDVCQKAATDGVDNERFSLGIKHKF